MSTRKHTLTRAEVAELAEPEIMERFERLTPAQQSILRMIVQHFDATGEDLEFRRVGRRIAPACEYCLTNSPHPRGGTDGC